MDLDPTDRAILYLLQEENQTHLTHDEIGDRIDVSSSTVSNRLRELKDEGVLRDYRPEIDYEAAEIPHHLLFICTTPIADRETICQRTVDVPGVVNVRELLTGSRNLHVEIVAMNTPEIEAVTEELDDLGLEIHQSEIVRGDYYQPFDQFGKVELESESESGSETESN
ncbi:winged helix-turn-helix transcriptional regulator [Natronorubrum sp. JWXQ-INN-674]|uniref:Winged helix-turn-helix transcriptional regulator n=1 Tax=Natronorubrum halalkaliphilum TaxID=2691917 RepID=A0A6B0VI56_9EURY|nr:Lrp/AsnC family transcriptional regulator [Natronorubrum halalkaliphilum]MXV61194.1 winged helix-turn-helix transcriptional regulator [Natronorubrum halalkaliphilum]